MTDRQASADSERMLSVLARIDYQSTITVLVGPKQQSFTVHNETICMRSPFFAAACSSRWAKGQEKVVRLPEQDPGVFREYVHWVYTNEIDLETLPGVMPATETYNDRDRVRVQTLKLYVLADVLRDTKLANKVKDMLVEVCCNNTRSLPGNRFFTTAYQHTTPGSPLRRMLVDLWAVKRRNRDLEVSVTELPRDFVNDLVVKLLSAAPQTTKAAFRRGTDRYHESEDSTK